MTDQEKRTRKAMDSEEYAAYCLGKSKGHEEAKGNEKRYRDALERIAEHSCKCGIIRKNAEDKTKCMSCIAKEALDSTGAGKWGPDDKVGDLECIKHQGYQGKWFHCEHCRQVKEPSELAVELQAQADAQGGEKQ